MRFQLQPGRTWSLSQLFFLELQVLLGFSILVGSSTWVDLLVCFFLFWRIYSYYCNDEIWPSNLVGNFFSCMFIGIVLIFPDFLSPTSWLNECNWWPLACLCDFSLASIYYILLLKLLSCCYMSGVHLTSAFFGTTPVVNRWCWSLFNLFEKRVCALQFVHFSA